MSLTICGITVDYAITRADAARITMTINARRRMRSGRWRVRTTAELEREVHRECRALVEQQAQAQQRIQRLLAEATVISLRRRGYRAELTAEGAVRILAMPGGFVFDASGNLQKAQ